MLFRHTDSQLLPGHDIAIILSIRGIPQPPRTRDIAHIQILLLFLTPVAVEPSAHRLRHERLLIHEELAVSASKKGNKIGAKHTQEECGFDDGAESGRERDCVVEDEAEDGGREERDDLEGLDVTDEESCDVAQTDISLSNEEEAEEEVHDHDHTDPVVEVAVGEREEGKSPGDVAVVVQDVEETEQHVHAHEDRQHRAVDYV